MERKHIGDALILTRRYETYEREEERERKREEEKERKREIMPQSSLLQRHCIIDDFYFYVIESVVLHRSLLAVPNTFMSFSPSLAEKKMMKMMKSNEMKCENVKRRGDMKC